MKMMLKAFLVFATTSMPMVSTGWAQDGGKREGQPAAEQSKEKPAKEKPGEEEPAKVDTVPEKVVSEKEAVKQLIGSYRIVSGQSSGEQVLPERLADVTVRITAETVTTYDGDKQQRFSAAYRLDTQKRPWRIKMKTTSTPATTGAAQPRPGTAAANSADAASEGLIELTENGAKLIYALPGGEAPRSFTSAARQQLFIMERLKEPTADKPATDKPATDKPATDKPATDKPATDKPATDKPATDKPAGEKP